MDTEHLICVLECSGTQPMVTKTLRPTFPSKTQFERGYGSTQTVQTAICCYDFQVIPIDGIGGNEMLFGDMGQEFAIDYLIFALRLGKTSGKTQPDDIAIYAIHRNINIASNHLQEALNIIRPWLENCRIALNYNKCEAMIFTLCRPANPPCINLSTNVMPWKPKDEATKIPEASITPRTTGRYLRDELRKRSFESWCQLPHKGKGVVIYQEYPRANSWVSTKKNLSSTEYINAIKMSCNLTAVRSVPGRAFSTTRCRQPGCNETETLGHVLGFCRKGELLRNNRHHRVRGAIACLLRNKG
ncbi:hypothetical protein ANN_11847 [Periplaneta americana]|uniref:Reverse transcriptase n=1 Tax=Periplaneta americana TaxID=6978 RepID=A0ABQ8T6U7_PERAM|nr:hypothetical protein ANN_11847 [Periplaneta americana]